MAATRYTKLRAMHRRCQCHWPARFPLLVFAATALLLLVTSPRTRSSPPQQPLQLSFSLEKKALTLHEPVVIRLRAVNKSDRPVRLDLGFDRVGNLQFLIARPGEKSTRVAQLFHGGIARTGIVTMAPGETYTQNILLSALYTFHAKGIYFIQVSLVSRSVAAHEDQPSAYKSQRMSLRFLPRDPSQLKKVCENLVEKIMSRNAASALESAKALSYVNDLVAVPYLEQAATSGPFNIVDRPMAIDGLARMSLAWGKKRVFSLLTQKDPTLKREISAHMSLIRTHATGPQD